MSPILNRFPKTTTEELDNFRDQLEAEAAHLITEKLPKTVLDLTGLIHSNKLSESHLTEILLVEILAPIEEVVGDDASKKDDSKDAKRTTLANNLLVSLLADIEKSLRASVDDFGTVALWLALLIPRVHDGGNFGCEVLEDVIKQVRSAAADTTNNIEQLKKYPKDRAQIERDIIENLTVQGYVEAVRAKDEETFYSARSAIIELRDQTTVLIDLITKNMDTIKAPRKDGKHLYH